jgi:hypothetical protein
MGIATGTAIALGISAVGTGASFVQAGKQNRLAKDAQTAADKAFKDAEAQLDVNYFEQLGISKTPYENQRNAITQASAQAMEVAKESDRGGAATAGRVLAQSNLAQQNITDQQTKDLEALNKLVATEESKLGTSRANLSLSQAEGAGIASAQAQNAANQSIAQGIKGIGNMAMMGLEASELYGSDGTVDTNNTLVSNNTDSFGVFASDANPYPQVVPSQNMFLPANQTPQYFQMQDALMYNGLFGPNK